MVPFWNKKTMKLLFDFLPIVLFFASYKLYGIYVATIVIMVAATLQTGLFWLKHRRFDFTYTVTLILVVILGGATLFFQNEMFIKWKPTAIYWAFAVVFMTTQTITAKPLVQRLMESKITLPKPVWNRLNMIWSVFFSIMGAVNLYVAYNFSTPVWVNFKLFGILGGTIAFGIIQSVYLTKHLKMSQERA